MGVDYEAKYNLKTLHDSFLTEMITFDQYCRENGIEYSLCGGTRLGAVRHAGFIPWDNDVDIEMVRIEYDKLIQCMECNQPEFIISNFLYEQKIIFRNQKDNNYIDLFVLDRAPDQQWKRRWKRFRLLILQGMLHENPPKCRKNIIVRVFLWITYFLGKPYRKDKLRKLYEKISCESNNCQTKQMTTYNTSYKLMCTYDTALIEGGYRDILFCGYPLRIFKKCKEMLKTQYGDYMRWPNEEDRRPSHQRHTDIENKKI